MEKKEATNVQRREGTTKGERKTQKEIDCRVTMEHIKKRVKGLERGK